MSEDNVTISHEKMVEFDFDTFVIYTVEGENSWKAKHENEDNFPDEIVLEENGEVTFAGDIDLFGEYLLTETHFEKLKEISNKGE